MKFIYLSDRKCLYGRDVYVRDSSRIVFRHVVDRAAECYVPVKPELAAELNALWRR